MLMNMLIMNLIMAIMMILTSHPLSLGSILLTQTILISLILGNLNLNFWYSYILFLIMIGGMLVLFIYMTSIASNEKFTTNIKLTYILSFLLMYFPMKKLFILLSTMFNNQEFHLLNTNIQYQFLMNKFINPPSLMIMMFMIFYLLMCLIAIVKIVGLTYGPLRPSN